MNSESSIQDLVGTLRKAELPRAMRGFQEEPARQLFEEAARRVEELASDNARLRVAASELEATVLEREAALADRAEPEATIRRALLAAARSAEELLADARQEADDLLVDARRAAEALDAERAREAERLAGARSAALEDVRRSADEARLLAAEQLETIHEQSRTLLEGLTGLHQALAAFSARTEQMLAEHRNGSAGREEAPQDFPLGELRPTERTPEYG